MRLIGLKITAFLMAGAVLVSAFPTMISADETGELKTGGIFTTNQFQCKKLSETEAAITGRLDGTISESEDLVIPESVEYQGKTYTVTQIGARYIYEDKNKDGVNDIPDYENPINFKDDLKINKLVVPKTVRLIEDAFDGCNINAIEFKSSELTLKNAFTDVKKLSSVNFPEGKLVLESKAFNSCPDLEEIVFNTTDLTVKASGIISCAKLSSIQFSPQVTASFSTGAFVDLKKLKTIEIPKGVKNPQNVFYKLGTIPRKVAISETNKDITVEDDIIYNADKTVLLWALNLSGEVTVRNGVKKIADRAFYNSRITGIVLPSSLTKIGNYAFYGVNRLKKVTIPKDVKSIGNGAFYKNTSLSKLFLPRGLKIIGTKAFYGNKKITSVKLPEYLSELRPMAFAKTGIKTIKIPEYVTLLSADAFYASKLKTVKFISGNENYTLRANSVFANSGNELVLAIPNGDKYTIYKDVKILNFKAFVRGSKKLVIPSNVKSIAFYEKSPKISSFKKVYFKGKNPPKTINRFDSEGNTSTGKLFSKSTKVYVPKKYVKAYKNVSWLNASQIKGY